MNHEVKVIEVDKPVAYMQGHHLVCPECTTEDTTVPVFKVNVYPYDQSCHVCGVAVVKGTFECELFDKAQCRVCEEASHDE